MYSLIHKGTRAQSTRNLDNFQVLGTLDPSARTQPLACTSAIHSGHLLYYEFQRRRVEQQGNSVKYPTNCCWDGFSGWVNTTTYSSCIWLSRVWLTYFASCHRFTKALPSMSRCRLPLDGGRGIGISVGHTRNRNHSVVLNISTLLEVVFGFNYVMNSLTYKL